MDHTKKRTQHVIFRPGGGWSVKKGGASRATKRFDRKEDAIRFARKISKQQHADLYIHRRDGMVIEKESFVNARD